MKIARYSSTEEGSLGNFAQKLEKERFGEDVVRT